MTDEDFGLTSLGQILIPVKDLARALAFYRDTLGMRFLFEVPRMAFFDLDGVRLMLAEQDEKTNHSGSILYYRVDDLQAAASSLNKRGVTCAQEASLIAEMEDHDLWMAFFQDSEGNHLALMSEVSNS